MSGIKIDTGVPMNRGTNAKYPWKEMNVGDSFVFPETVKITSVYAFATQANKNHAPRKFATRKQADGTYRCWRIA